MEAIKGRFIYEQNNVTKQVVFLKVLPDSCQISILKDEKKEYFKITQLSFVND